MAYTDEQLIKMALKAVKNQHVHFIEDIAIQMGINKGTFYSRKLNENDVIKQAIHDERVTIKSNLRAKWYQSNAPALQIALYKLLATKEELDILTLNKNEHSGTISLPPFGNVPLSKLPGQVKKSAEATLKEISNPTQA